MVEKMKHIKFLKKLTLIQLLISVLILCSAITLLELSQIKFIWFTVITCACILSCGESMIVLNFFRQEEKVCRLIMKRRKIKAGQQKIMEQNAALDAKDRQAEWDQRTADSWTEFFKLEGTKQHPAVMAQSVTNR